MGRDLDGEYWCRDWFDCNRITKERLANPDAMWRKRREVARLEWLENPPTVAEMFGLVVDTVALFGLDGPVPAKPVVDVHDDHSVQLGLL
jgi:hypothetical protein